LKARHLVAGLALLISACVTKPAIETITGKPIPENEVKATILALTRGEWEAFGKQRIYWEDGAEVIRPVGLWEDDKLGSERVAQYWRVLDPDSELTGMNCAEPWSAAFISWVMIRAGVDPRQFTRSAAHRDYLRTIIAHADDPDFKFRPRAPADYAPKPGDIICRGRGSTREITDFHALPEGAELHCDIVVANADGKLESIGGNVRQSVSLSERAVDAAGKLDAPWFVVIQNRYPDPQTPVAFQ
jgi:hypothetical protein